MLKTLVALLAFIGFSAGVACANISGSPIDSLSDSSVASPVQDQDEDDDDDDDEKEDDHAKVVKLSDVPAAARKAIKKAAGAHEIEEVKSEKIFGVMVFEAVWEVDEMDREIVVTANGTILEMEQTIAMKNAPEAVQKMARKMFGKGTEVVVEKKTVVFYSVEAMVGDEEQEMLLTGTGQVVEIEADDESEMEHGEAKDDDDHGDDDDGEHKAGKASKGNKNKADKDDDDDDDHGNDDDGDHKAGKAKKGNKNKADKDDDDDDEEGDDDDDDSQHKAGKAKKGHKDKADKDDDDDDDEGDDDDDDDDDV